MTEDNLIARVAREVKCVLREYRETRFSPQQLAERIVNDPMIYRAACLYGNGRFYRAPNGTLVTEPDIELVASWIDGAIRKFKGKATKLQKWVRRNCYVTKWQMDDAEYYLPGNPA